MSLCVFSKDTAAMDITPIENLFIGEYMIKAPGDFVKVYIYGLMQCYYPAAADTSLYAFAEALCLDESTVQDAFSYWQRHGLIKKISADPVQIEFYSVKGSVFSGAAHGSGAVVQYAELNNALHAIFTGRLFTTGDYQKMYDWVEVYGLSEDAVIKLLGYCAQEKGGGVRLSYMDKVALSWAKAGVKTPEDADERIELFERASSGANKVLRHIGIRRKPTADEVDLYNKWTREWGFSLDAVLLACREMTRIQNPNFAYVDRVLESYKNRGCLSAREIDEHFNQRHRSERDVIAVLDALGIKGSPRQEHLDAYKRWTLEYGFDAELIQLTCAYAMSAKSRPTFKDIERMLGVLKEKHVKTMLEAERTLCVLTEMDSKAEQVMERAGVSRAPTPVERKLFDTWLLEWKLPVELLLLAAESTAGAARPFALMKKIIEDWHAGGIFTVNAAKANLEKRPSGHNKKEKEFKERDYMDDEILSRAMKLGVDGGA